MATGAVGPAGIATTRSTGAGWSAPPQPPPRVPVPGPGDVGAMGPGEPQYGTSSAVAAVPGTGMPVPDFNNLAQGEALLGQDPMGTLMGYNAALAQLFQQNGGGGGGGGGSNAAALAAARRRIQEMYASMLGTLNTNVGTARGQITSTSEDLMRKLTALRDRSQRENAMAAEQMRAMYAQGIAGMGGDFDQAMAAIQARGGSPAEMQMLRREQMGLLQADALRSRALMGGNNAILNGLMNGRVATGQTLGTASLQQLSNAQVQAAAALDRQKLQALAQYEG